MTLRQPDSLLLRQRSVVIWQQDGCLRFIHQEEIPAVLVPLESGKQYARSINCGVALPSFDSRLREPIHVLDPRSCCDMGSRQHEVSRRQSHIVRDRDHDEVLTLMLARAVRFCSQGPADRSPGGSSRRLDLDLDQTPILRIAEHGKDVSSFQPIAGECRSPATSSQLGRRVMLADRLCLLRVDHRTSVLRPHEATGGPDPGPMTHRHPGIGARTAPLQRS